MQTALVLDFTVAHGMSEQEARAWYVIRNREGAANAIGVKDLAERIDTSPRNAQRIVRRLIHDFGKAVGTSMTSPFGYYHATTPEERAQVAKLHRDRALAELGTAAKILGIDRAEYVRRFQLELGNA
jgi:hypothetical protein